MDNKWLLSGSIESFNIKNEDKEYFISLCKRIYTSILSFPVPVYVRYLVKQKSFLFAIGSSNLELEWSKNINPHDYAHLVYTWAYKLFPYYTISSFKERDLTKDEISNLVIKEGRDFNEVINLKKKIKYIENLKVEKIVMSDEELNVSINKKHFVLISRIPVSLLNSRLRKSQDNEEKANLIKQHTRKLLEVTNWKVIEIKYNHDQLINFFKIRSLNLSNEPLKQIKNLEYRWGRFYIFFETKDQFHKALEIMDWFEKKYKSIKNIDSFIINEYNGKISGGKK